MADPDYDDSTARHYAAYRPPLHGLLLGRCLEGRYASGLDIGCGTGHSTRALREYCDRVTGIDPSAAMLARVPTSEGIDYRLFDGRRLPFPAGSFDVLTFAGSLFYGKSQQLLEEVERVGRLGGAVVVYDFLTPSAELADRLLGVRVPATDSAGYDHTVTFDNLQPVVLRHRESRCDLITVSMKPGELAEMLLSERPLRTALRTAYGATDLPAQLESAIRNALPGAAKTVNAAFQVFTALYLIGAPYKR
ncbi:SAM-dependent methyltransferase [Lewinella aquimaris]|uniref:SAM-dependent methyltransferase n=1 Tax=Neolewinella aquimaris TaxID=1835722 RepID=A0A840DZJ6_9BACT|nr:class I SAM-dependent methyltransferase [Neolewinella aquimaris]MBB4078421.1 SAM-dependent methyltransferase [Neolewinella aquimaris]